MFLGRLIRSCGRYRITCRLCANAGGTPYTANGKTDRAALGAMVAHLHRVHAGADNRPTPAESKQIEEAEK